MLKKICCLVFAMVALVVIQMSELQGTSQYGANVQKLDVLVIDEPIDEYEVKKYYDVPLDTGFQDYIRNLCESLGVDMKLVLAVMKVESDFNTDLISSTNDYGIMQINQINHERLTNELDIQDYLDPYDCTKAGIYMLSNLNWCENDAQKLMCYNMGTAGAKKYWNQDIYETQYTRKVLEAKTEIEGSEYEVKILCD